MLLICLLAAAQPPVVGPRHDLASYLAVAAQYRSSDRDAARREIREWRFAELEAAVRALREAENRLRAIPVQATDIDFRTVEAAVLMHAEVGLVHLQALSPVDAQTHLETSLRLFEWSRSAATRLRERASRRKTPQTDPHVPVEEFQPGIAAIGLELCRTGHRASLASPPAGSARSAAGPIGSEAA